jgi:hypothetical protein
MKQTSNEHRHGWASRQEDMNSGSRPVIVASRSSPRSVVRYVIEYTAGRHLRKPFKHRMAA